MENVDTALVVMAISVHKSNQRALTVAAHLENMLNKMKMEVAQVLIVECL